MNNKTAFVALLSSLIIGISVVLHGACSRFDIAQIRKQVSSSRSFVSTVLVDRLTGTVCYFPDGNCYSMTGGKLEQVSAWWENEDNFVPAGDSQKAKPWDRYRQQPTLTPVEGDPFEGEKE